jgi:hypothetical protein
MISDAAAGFPKSLAMCQMSLPQDGSDEIERSLLYFFMKHDQATALVCAMITREVNESVEPSTLFSPGSSAARMFKYFARAHGLNYIFSTFGVLFQELIVKEKQMDADLEDENTKIKEGRLVSKHLFGEGMHEIDPQMMSAEELDDLSLNTTQLCLTSQKFITQLFRSVFQIPPEIRVVCNHVATEVARKFGNDSNTRSAIAAFLFSRFICVAIAYPDDYGLLKKEPRFVYWKLFDFPYSYFSFSQSMRRTLMLVDTVIRHLASGSIYGKSQKAMAGFDELLASNFAGREKFLSDVCAVGNDDHSKVSVPSKVYLLSLAFIYASSLEENSPN